MSMRAKLYEKYRKSDIFNLSSSIDNNKTSIRVTIPYLNNTFDSKNPILGIEKPKKTQKKILINNKKYASKHHQSDIFNLNNSVDSKKPQKIKKQRNIPNNSTCFDSMKDNEQFAQDIKEYTLQSRAKKTVYNPLKYYNEMSAHQRLYSQYYDKNRNPISHFHQKNNSMMKSSANLFSNMKIDFINLNNTYDKIKIEDDLDKNVKAHKFYRIKGFTYHDYDAFTGNNHTIKNFISSENNFDNINTSKINKQLQLQSNIFNNDENMQKNENDINKIKQRIKTAKNSDEANPKKRFFFLNKFININDNNNNENEENKKLLSSSMTENNTDRNTWGAVHNNWENSNLDWKNEKTEIIFTKKNNNNQNENITPFQRKMNQLADSNNQDTINETIKLNRKTIPTRRRFISNNLEQIDEILNDIPNNVLKYDKKKKILSNANTIGLNGESEVDKNILNYKKFHKNNLLNNKNKKELTIKIMSKESQNFTNNKKKEEKICNNLRKFDNYNIHEYTLSYDVRNTSIKNTKNNFDKFSEKDVKLLFSKNGVHIYDIKKNMFNNGKYNTIKFKVRENEGEQILDEKMKEIENEFNKKEYKISIKKDEEKNNKKNLRHVAKIPYSKKAIFVDDVNNKNNNTKQNEKNKIKNHKKNVSFSSHNAVVNSSYKNHYKEEQMKNKVNK